MQHRDRAAEARGVLLTREDLIAEGWGGERIARSVRTRDLVRLGRARYAHARDLRALYPEQRVLARVFATAPSQNPRAVYCGESAAALHGLPLYRPRSEQAHVLLPDSGRVRSSIHVRRSVGALRDDEIVEREGVKCTVLHRTVTDLARFSDSALAIAAADAAVKLQVSAYTTSLIGGVRAVDRAEQERTAAALTALLLEELQRKAGHRGVARAQALLARVNHLADSPLESVARFLLEELGFEVAVQVAVPGPNGSNFYIDLELEGADVLCEIDGRVKYTDPAMLAGRTPDDVFRNEKFREDWVRGVTNKRVIRLTADDLRSVLTLAARLRAFGIDIPRPPR